MHKLITDHIDIWTAAIIPKKSGGRGRGSNSKKSPHGIQKLRELILELAVRGKLVPQDPNDEPASELLKRIAAEKNKLIKEGKIKKQKSLPAIVEDDIPFGIPLSWVWSRITDLYYSISPSGSKLKTSEILEEGSHPVVDQGQSFISGYTNNSELLIEIPGPVIIFGDHTTQKKYIDFDFVAGADGTKILRPYNMDEKYFFTYLLSLKLENRGYARHFKVLNSSFVGVPPLAEQHRIVAKVDELMALCDQLEQEQTENSEAHQTLVEALLSTLTQAEDNRAFQQAWQRIAEHFDTLFTTEPSIDQLKQTILQLAVMGKLVPQDPTNEPASELLKKITAEKAQRIKSGKLKKQKPLLPIGDAELLFELPKGWLWCRIGSIYCFLNGFAFKSEWFKSSGVKLLRNINILHGETRWEETVFVSKEIAEELSAYALNEGDIVLSLDRPIINSGLKFAVISKPDLPCLLLQRVAKFHSVEDVVSPLFLTRWMESDYFISKIDPGRSNGVPHISTKQIENMVFALPPVEEQHRIVAKVDELMAICDALKAQLQEAQATQLQLADAIVEQAVA